MSISQPPARRGSERQRLLKSPAELRLNLGSFALAVGGVSFVEKLDFCTSLGHGLDSDVRRRHGVRGKGPSAVVSDLGVLRPDSETGELIMTELFPGVSRRAVRDRTGWSSLRFSEQVAEVPPPSECELRELRSLTAARDLSRGTSQASR